MSDAPGTPCFRCIFIDELVDLSPIFRTGIETPAHRTVSHEIIFRSPLLISDRTISMRFCPPWLPVFCKILYPAILIVRSQANRPAVFINFNEPDISIFICPFVFTVQDLSSFCSRLILNKSFIICSTIYVSSVLEVREFNIRGFAGIFLDFPVFIKVNFPGPVPFTKRIKLIYGLRGDQARPKKEQD